MATWTADDVKRLKSSIWTAEDVKRLKEQPQKEEKPLTPGLKSFVEEKLETGKLMKTIQDPLASPRDKLEARIKLTPELPMIDTNKLEPPKPDRNLINMFDSSTTGGYLANKAISGMYGVAEGLEGFREMLSPDPLPGKTKKRLIDPELTARERAELAQTGEDKSGLVRFAGDVVEGATGMLPTVALGAASGGTMGIPFVMQQAAGRGFTEALQEGADRGQARLYGAGSGLLEGGIEAVIGGVPGMKGVADPLVDSATQGIRSKILKEVAKRGLDALGEGAEEVLSTALDPLLKRATYDKDAQFASGSDLLRSFGTGAVTSALLQAPSAIADIAGRKTLPTIQEPQNATVEPSTDSIGKESYVAQNAAQDPILTATVEPETTARPQPSEMPDTKQYISMEPQKTPAGNVVKKAYSSLVDDLYPIKETSAEAYKKALNSRHADMIAYQSIKNGLVDQQGNIVNEGLEAITKDIPKGKVDDFVDYLVNRHAPTWLEQGRKVFPDDANITADISRAKAAQYEAENPIFKELGDRFTRYQQQLAKTWLVDSGIMSQEMWDSLVQKYPDYVPFQREYSEIERGQGQNAKRGFVNQKNPVKKGKGSQRKIIDPIETVYARTGQYIKTAKRNAVGQTILNEVRNNPQQYSDIIEIVEPEDTKSAQATQEFLDDINKTLRDDGIDGLVEKLNKPYEGQQFVASKGLKGANIVTVLENGSPVYLRIKDMDLLKALTNLNPQQATAVTRAVGKVTGMMKTLTTGLNPAFALARNIWRDFVTGYVNSKTINANPLGYAQYTWDLVKAIGNIIADPLGKAKFLPDSFKAVFKKGSQPYQYFKNIGGGGHASSISSDRDMLARAKPSLYEQSRLSPKKLVEGLEAFNNVLEAAPRLAEAKRVLAKGGSVEDALFESQDLTVNFSKKGNITKELDAFTPYLNAAVQGLDKLARNFIEPGWVGRVVKAAYSITIPTLILYALNHDREEYEQLSDYQKDNYFNIYNGDGTFTRIPKPRELGVIFGVLPERTLRALKDNDPDAFKRFADTVKLNFLPPDPITDNIIMPGYDIWATKEGRDWRGNPVVNQSMLGLSPRYQYDEKTSEPAKALGDLLNLSPKKIDATLRAYTGGLAQFGLPATTKGSSLADTLKAQFVTDPLYSNDILNDFYARLEELDRIARDRNFKEGIPSKLVTPEERTRNAMQKVADRIAELNKRKKQMDDEETIRQLQQEILKLAKEALEKY